MEGLNKKITHLIADTIRNDYEKVLVEDDASPDAFEFFEKDLIEQTNLTVKKFKYLSLMEGFRFIGIYDHYYAYDKYILSYHSYRLFYTLYKKK